MFYKDSFIKKVIISLITQLLVLPCILSACGQKGKTTAESNLSGKKAAELFSGLNQFAELNHSLFRPEESSNVENTFLPATPDNSPFVIKDGVLLSYKGHEMEVVVPDGVERIGKEAFRGNKILRRVVLPEGLCSIGESAFSGCSNLVEVQLPKEVSDIRQRAFSDCKKLEKINLQNVKSIAGWAFLDCSSLCSVYLEGITKLSDGAFYGTGLEEIRGMGELSEIGDNVFYGTPIIEHYSTLFDTDLLIIQHVLLAGYCSEGDVVIPDEVEIIAPRAFEDAVGIRSVVCGGKVGEIGEHAFAGCLNLERFWMGDSVTKVGEQIFRDATQLCDLRISEQLRVIPDAFLSECSALKMVTLPEQCAVSGWFSLGYAVSKGGAMVTLPPRKKVFSFLKQPWRGDYKVYTTELPEDTEWSEASKIYGWSLDFLELTTKEVVLTEGETYKLAFNSGAKAYWKSLDENVVLVDCDGGLTAYGTGETDVVATIYGTEYKCHIVVKGGTASSSEFTGKKSFRLGNLSEYIKAIDATYYNLYKTIFDAMSYFHKI